MVPATDDHHLIEDKKDIPMIPLLEKFINQAAGELDDDAVAMSQ